MYMYKVNLEGISCYRQSSVNIFYLQNKNINS